MVCPICKNTVKKYSFLLKDYEYDIKNNTRYFICNNCKAIYRNKAWQWYNLPILYSEKNMYKIFDKTLLISKLISI